MKLVIISDIHDNIINLAKCLNWCNQENIDAMICCGDITNSETLEFLTGEFYKNIYLVKGNTEIYEESELKNYDNINYLGKFGRFRLENKFIGVCHEPEYISDVVDKGPCDIIFCGHTHQPWQEQRGNTIVVNVGTISGIFYKACFAAWDIEMNKLDLILLELIK